MSDLPAILVDIFFGGGLPDLGFGDAFFGGGLLRRLPS
jgi:hypothetical protein